MFTQAKPATILARDDSMTFRDPLPEGCPPDDAIEITLRRTVFRVVSGDPPTDDDFRSQRSEKPRASFNAPECLARGLSVYSDMRDAARLLKLPKFRGMLICQVTLERGAGNLSETTSRSHVTWWPFAAFNILRNCEMVDS